MYKSINISVQLSAVARLVQASVKHLLQFNELHRSRFEDKTLMLS